MVDLFVIDLQLQAMLDRSRTEKLLFQSTYDPGLIFTADELEQCWKEKRFRWGAVNWVLVTPSYLLFQKETRAKEKNYEARSFREEMERLGYL